jgi:hypothetical protein
VIRASTYTPAKTTTVISKTPKKEKNIPVVSKGGVPVRSNNGVASPDSQTSYELISVWSSAAVNPAMGRRRSQGA